MSRAPELVPHHPPPAGATARGNHLLNIVTVTADQVIDPPAARGGGASVSLRGVAVVAVEGDIDLYSGPDLRWALADLLSPVAVALRGAALPATVGVAAPGDDLAASLWAVIVDLSEVEFIDSYVVGVLVQGHHLARRSGRAYALVATHPMIHRLFEITGLARVLPLHPDVAAAVAAVHPGARRTAT